VTGIALLRDGRITDWTIEARPSTTGIKFALRLEKHLTASATLVRPRIGGIPIFASKRAFGTFLPKYMVLV
jgi:hypothetical protein